MEKSVWVSVNRRHQAIQKLERLVRNPGIIPKVLKSNIEVLQSLLCFLNYLVMDHSKGNCRIHHIKQMFAVLYIYALHLKDNDGRHGIEDHLPIFMENFLMMLKSEIPIRIRVMYLKAISCGTEIAHRHTSPYLSKTYRILHKYLNMDCRGDEEAHYLRNIAFETISNLIDVADNKDVLPIAYKMVKVFGQCVHREDQPDFDGFEDLLLRISIMVNMNNDTLKRAAKTKTKTKTRDRSAIKSAPAPAPDQNQDEQIKQSETKLNSIGRIFIQGSRHIVKSIYDMIRGVLQELD